jgi:hypothetical protein
MTGCQDDEYARAACTAPLSDGSTWVLSATSTTTIGAQICRNDGACASRNLYEAPPRVYESWRYVAVTVADRIVIYDKQAAHFQIFAVPSDYSIVASAWSPSTP